MNLLLQRKARERKHEHQQQSMSVRPFIAAAIKCLVLSITWLKYVVMLHFNFFCCSSFHLFTSDTERIPSVLVIASPSLLLFPCPPTQSAANWHWLSLPSWAWKTPCNLQMPKADTVLLMLHENQTKAQYVLILLSRSLTLKNTKGHVTKVFWVYKPNINNSHRQIKAISSWSPTTEPSGDLCN